MLPMVLKDPGKAHFKAMMSQTTEGWQGEVTLGDVFLMADLAVMMGLWGLGLIVGISLPVLVEGFFSQVPLMYVFSLLLKCTLGEAVFLELPRPWEGVCCMAGQCPVVGCRM